MKKKIINEIAVYLIIPLLIWNLGRKELGDYYAMLLTALPGFIYTALTFFKDKQYNITGIFFISSLLIRSIADIASGSALRILWNDVYINIAYVLFHSVTVIVKKPIGMYFFIDYAYLQGYARESSKKLYTSEPLFKYFQYLTLLFAIKAAETAILKAWLITKYGLEGFNQISIIMSINGYVYTAITIIFIYALVKKIEAVAHSYNKADSVAAE